MAQEAKIPGSFWARVQKMIDDSITKFARSGFLRNASITGGAGLSIKDGGALRLDTATGVESFRVGPVNPSLADGSPQPGMVVRRNDGSVAMILWDPAPTSGGYNQYLGIYDRAGHAIFTDDTNSGFGVARPHLGHAFYPSRAQDFPKSTATAFETVWRARVEKQQPQLYVECWGYCDTSDTHGSIQVMVNGVQLGATVTPTNSQVSFFTFGPAPVAGNFGDILSLEIQAKRTAGTGNVQVGAAMASGWQS